MSDINYKPLIEEKIQEFFKQHPDYTYGELIYSICASLRGKRVEKKSDFMTLPDSEFYTGLDVAFKREQKEENENQ